jgi:hypothetical protein
MGSHGLNIDLLNRERLRRLQITIALYYKDTTAEQQGSQQKAHHGVDKNPGPNRAFRNQGRSDLFYILRL